MMTNRAKALKLAEEKIINKIYLVRGKKVMLDFELSEMYDVETKQLKRQVRRNIDRFPSDFMFVLKDRELEILRSQIGTSRLNRLNANFPNESPGWGGIRYNPMAFTEQGVAMLSSVLNSKTAISVNIRIIRVFTRMRELLLANKDILIRLEQLEKKILRQGSKIKKYGEDIQLIFEALKQLLHPPREARPKIGFMRNRQEE